VVKTMFIPMWVVLCPFAQIAASLGPTRVSHLVYAAKMVDGKAASKGEDEM